MASPSESADNPKPTPSSPTGTIRRGLEPVPPSDAKVIDYAAAVKTGLPDKGKHPGPSASQGLQALGNGRPVRGSRPETRMLI